MSSQYALPRKVRDNFKVYPRLYSEHGRITVKLVDKERVSERAVNYLLPDREALIALKLFEQVGPVEMVLTYDRAEYNESQICKQTFLDEMIYYQSRSLINKIVFVNAKFVAFKLDATGQRIPLQWYFGYPVEDLDGNVLLRWAIGRKSDKQKHDDECMDCAPTGLFGTTSTSCVVKQTATDRFPSLDSIDAVQVEEFDTALPFIKSHGRAASIVPAKELLISSFYVGPEMPKPEHAHTLECADGTVPLGRCKHNRIHYSARRAGVISTDRKLGAAPTVTSAAVPTPTTIFTVASRSDSHHSREGMLPPSAPLPSVSAVEQSRAAMSISASAQSAVSMKSPGASPVLNEPMSISSSAGQAMSVDVAQSVSVVTGVEPPTAQLARSALVLESSAAPAVPPGFGFISTDQFGSDAMSTSSTLSLTCRTPSSVPSLSLSATRRSASSAPVESLSTTVRTPSSGPAEILSPTVRTPSSGPADSLSLTRRSPSTAPVQSLSTTVRTPSSAPIDSLSPTRRSLSSAPSEILSLTVRTLSSGPADSLSLTRRSPSTAPAQSVSTTIRSASSAPSFSPSLTRRTASSASSIGLASGSTQSVAGGPLSGSNVHVKIEPPSTPFSCPDDLLYDCAGVCPEEIDEQPIEAALPIVVGSGSPSTGSRILSVKAVAGESVASSVRVKIEPASSPFSVDDNLLYDCSGVGAVQEDGHFEQPSESNENVITANSSTSTGRVKLEPPSSSFSVGSVLYDCSSEDGGATVSAVVSPVVDTDFVYGCGEQASRVTAIPYSMVTPQDFAYDCEGGRVDTVAASTSMGTVARVKNESPSSLSIPDGFGYICDEGSGGSRDTGSVGGRTPAGSLRCAVAHLGGLNLDSGELDPSE